jgi:hypothetical protein
MITAITTSCHLEVTRLQPSASLPISLYSGAHVAKEGHTRAACRKEEDGRGCGLSHKFCQTTVAQAYQCDKCQTFYTDDPYTLEIRDVTRALLLQKDLCEKCQTPPDFVVKCQAFDIVGVILRLV